MWKLTKITATNICAFKELEYVPIQGKTMLVFGHNLDNDAQGSNGSGKSALIEAFAIAFTGEPLRKVNTEEIINDAADEAEIVCVLTNDMSNDEFVIKRKISRSEPQAIHVTMNGVAMPQSSVNEYNRYILHVLGVTKDDIYSSFILSKHKFQSFLNAPDRTKKELINRFSNGDMVDESIEHLKKDLRDANVERIDLEKSLARCEGKLSAINDQIANAQNEESSRLRQKAECIASHEASIANLRGQIREAKQQIEQSSERRIVIENCLNYLEQLEETSEPIQDSYNKILDMFAVNGVPKKDLKDYPAYAERLKVMVEEHSAKVKDIERQITGFDEQLIELSNKAGALREKYEEFISRSTPAREALKEYSNKAREEISQLTTQCQDLIKQSAELRKQISDANAVLAGSIECPSCHHKFFFDSTRTIEEVERQIGKFTKQLAKTDKSIDECNVDIEKRNSNIEKRRKAVAKFDVEQDVLTAEMQQINASKKFIASRIESVNATLVIEKAALTRASNQMVELRKSMFDYVFDRLDEIVRHLDTIIKQKNVSIDTAQGHIVSYEEAIEELKNNTTSFNMTQLLNQRDRIIDEAGEIRNELDGAIADVMRLSVQEERFVEFKTHLANSKIEALGNLTNEFLEAIGSDIRIAFSGFTVLKSGKVRDKISTSILRNGADCGSFGKFSAGEQCRANLASVLALHKLTNSTCEEGKGLDLLILDEILDATDEAGLANMFEALNTLQLTSLVVSHGLIAESYKYKMTVTKQNGVSTINQFNV